MTVAPQFVKIAVRWALLTTATALLFDSSFVQAGTLYSLDFEDAPVGTLLPGALGLSSSTLNMGSSVLTWEVTAAGGTDDSQGFLISFDSTDRPIWIVSFGVYDPLDAVESPLDNVGVSSASQISLSVDAKTIGNSSSMPLHIVVFQFDADYEASHGVDANLDGDMNDGATVFRSTVTPTLTDGDDYGNVNFTLNEGSISADILYDPEGPEPPETVPIAPQFDPTVPLSWSIRFDWNGFGSDGGNMVSIDNVLIESVPEPETLALAALTISALLIVGPRRHGVVRSGNTIIREG